MTVENPCCKWGGCNGTGRAHRVPFSDPEPGYRTWKCDHCGFVWHEEIREETKVKVTNAE